MGRKLPDEGVANHAPVWFESKAQRFQRRIKRRMDLVRTLSLTLGIATLISLVLSLLNFFGSNSLAQTLMAVIAGVCYWGVYLMVRFGTTARQLAFATYLVVGTTLGSIMLAQLLIGILPGLISSFFLIPVLCGLLDLTGLANLIMVMAGGVGLYVFSTLERLSRLEPDVPVSWNFWIIASLNWLIIYIIIAVGIAVFGRRQRQALTVDEQQTEQLGRLIQALNSTTRFGANLSQDLAGTTTQLTTTSQQHASSTQEQVAAVSQITTSLEELNETASQIANSAQVAARSANQTLQIAEVVKQASQLSQSTAQEGNQAVRETGQRISQVRDRIEVLGQRLLHLIEQTTKVGTIIGIIEDIADETHLLALNASIEAAGSASLAGGQLNQEASFIKGERFNIIAQEVKNLADRSREATKEVRSSISEMQGAVAAAVLVAEEGKKESASTLTQAQIMGAVIEKLTSVISKSATQAEQILQAVEEVNVRCDEISLATNQQRSANYQILQTMHGVSEISHQNAGVVRQLTETVAGINWQVDELNKVLARSNQSLETLSPV